MLNRRVGRLSDKAVFSDYYSTQPNGETGEHYSTDPTSLPGGATVAIGTSPVAVLTLLIILSVMMIIFLGLSLRPTIGNMPVVGSNSLAIAANCRISPLSKVPRSFAVSGNGFETELEELMPPSFQGPQTRSDPEDPRDMIYSRLKWGEVKMPDEWYDQGDETREVYGEVGHLSFGTVMDDPQPPKEGRWYR